MNVFFKFVSLLTIIFIAVSCGDKDKSVEEKVAEGTIAIGKFRLTGQAQSGPYALKLFKIDRFVADEFSQISAWTLVESERKAELQDERGEVITEPTRTDQFINSGVNKLEKELFGNSVAVHSSVPASTIEGYPAADFILVGQMDGFDFDIDRQTNLIETRDGQEVAATLNSRAYVAQSSLSVRLIKVETREIILAKRIFFRARVNSTGSMESQVNEVLRRMASRLVAETLLSLSGDIQVAAVNADGTLLLNRGIQSGLKVGMNLDLKHLGVMAKDPVTGKDLARSSHKIGMIKIQSVSETTSIAKYEGEGTPGIEDLAVFDNSQFEKQKKGFQPIRMAIGTVTFTDVSPKAPDKFQRFSLVKEIEQGLAQQLNGKLGIKIVDQQSQRIKDMLAQQMLSDLNQGREPGLPLGTMRGVDYLVFMSIVRSELSSPEKKKVYMKVLDKYVDQIKSGKGYLKAYVFLQDVNTAETAARTEIKFHKKFKRELTTAKAWSEMIEGLMLKVNKSILTQLRPLQVLSNANGRVMLSHGRDVLSIGDSLTVFGKGETIIDPYTGQRISNVGSVDIAHLKVTAFQPGGYALAELVSGQLPAAGMGVTVDTQQDCLNGDCDENDGSMDMDDVKPKKREVHQYNF